MKLFQLLSRKSSTKEHHIVYSNNDEYHGEMKDNMKHGKGVYKFVNGNRYEGEWMNNEKHGNGKYFYNTGELYIGQWQHNKKSGHGQHFGIYGDRYIGQWKNNVKHGKGTIYYGDNSVFSGEFVESKKHGSGYFYNPVTRELFYQLYDHDKMKKQQRVDQVPYEYENVFSAVLVKESTNLHPQPLPNKQIKAVDVNQNEAIYETSVIQAEKIQEKGRKKMQEWNIDEVCIWLDCLGLAQYKEAFIKNHMIGETLHDLCDRELREELGIENTKHRKLILQEINMHKKYYIKTMSEQVQVLQKPESESGEHSVEHASKYDQLFSIIQKIEPQTESPLIEAINKKKNKRRRSSSDKEKQNDQEDEQDENEQEIENEPKQSPKQGNQGSSFKLDDSFLNFNNNEIEKEIKKSQSSSSDVSSSSSKTDSDKQQESSSPNKTQIISEKNLQQKHHQKLLSLLKDLGINEKFLINYKEIKQGVQIGEGSYGIVYSGKWLGQDVAIKSYCKRKSQKSKEAMADFLKEVQVISNLRHPNILLYMGVCIMRSNFYLITELLENGSLFDHIHKRKNKSLNVIQIIEDIALGMNYLHGRNVMHCDLKSSNVLIDQDGNVKLCDFGLSRIKSKKTKSAVGTPHWMAPEIMRGEPYIDKSDVYSFGMILWEIITGKVPYENMTRQQIIKNVGWGTSIIEIPNTSNPSILAILAKDCLQMDPNKRPTFTNLVARIQESQRSKNKNKEKVKKYLFDFLLN